jgi:hypothetical protein
MDKKQLIIHKWNDFGAILTRFDGWMEVLLQADCAQLFPNGVYELLSIVIFS